MTALFHFDTATGRKLYVQQVQTHLRLKHTHISVVRRRGFERFKIIILIISVQQQKSQPRSQGLLPGLGAGRGKDPGNEVAKIFCLQGHKSFIHHYIHKCTYMVLHFNTD